MALDAGAIADGIAALVVPGVTIKSLADMPLDLARAGLPVLMPDPDNWGGEVSAEMETFGFASGSMWHVTRVLGYLYAHAPVGANRSPFEFFAAMSDNRDAIIEAILELDIAGVDVVGLSAGKFSVLQSPAGTGYHGFLLGVVVREKVNP
jgi:hypothetical protein